MCFTAVIYRIIASPENCHYGVWHNLPFKLSEVAEECAWRDVRSQADRMRIRKDSRKQQGDVEWNCGLKCSAVPN